MEEGIQVQTLRNPVFHGLVEKWVEEGVGGEEVKIEWADSISGSVAIKGIT